MSHNGFYVKLRATYLHEAGIKTDIFSPAKLSPPSFFVIQFGSIFRVCPVTGATEQKPIRISMHTFLNYLLNQQKVNIQVSSRYVVRCGRLFNSFEIAFKISMK